MVEPVTLVVGASGLLGNTICRGLLARSSAVRAMARSGQTEQHLATLGCTTVRGDLRDQDTLARACEGIATVVVTATALGSVHDGRNRLERVDRDGALALIEAARLAGVGQFVYTSVSPSLPATCAFIRCKRVVEQALRASGMTYTILQPAAFMEIHTGPIGGWDYERGQARIVGSGRTPMSYISVADVAAFAVACVGNPWAANRALHLAGPEPITALDAVAIAERITGRKFRVQRMPAFVLAAAATLLLPFNPPLASLLRLVATTDIGSVVDMEPVRRELSVAQTTFESYVRQTTATAGRN